MLHRPSALVSRADGYVRSHARYGSGGDWKAGFKQTAISIGRDAGAGTVLKKISFLFFCFLSFLLGSKLTTEKPKRAGRRLLALLCSAWPPSSSLLFPFLFFFF
jgi:hypothetical protein